MTSTASQQNVTAQIPTTVSSASYASAAGASGRPAATPVIAPGSYQPPVVVDSIALAQHHAKSSSVSPMNGNKPHMMPVPVPVAPGAPAVVHGTSNLNGNATDHSRKSSVTINGPGYPLGIVGNGGPVGVSKPGLPKFGFESPANVHSTPQQVASAPIPIPGTVVVPSPAHSPSPIPQPSASGGRPPSTIPQDGSTMKFGSLGGEGDRHMKHLGNMPQNSIPLGAQSPHLRRDSTHSTHSDMGNHMGPGPNRPNFQAGRGRGYGHSHNNGQFANQGGFPPQAQYPRGPSGQGRGAMQPYQTRNPMGNFPHSPQPPRASPALTHSMPNTGTPHMQAAVPIPPAGGYGYQYQPQPGGYPPPQNNYPPYAPQTYDPRMPMAYPGYAPVPMGYMNPASQSPAPGYPHGYANPPYTPPVAPAMSRNSSQISERPNSSTGQIQAPVIVQGGTAQPNMSQPKPASGTASSQFVIPKKTTAKISIRNPQGETIDLKSLKTPASPAPSARHSTKTPPVVASTPTPPPTSAAPSHGRSESAATSKTAEQLRNEFREQVRKSTEAPAAETKPKEHVEKPAAPEDLPKEEKPKEDALPEEAAKPAAEAEVAAETKKADATPEAKDEPKAAPVTETEKKEEVKEKEEKAPAAAAAAAAPAPAPAPADEEDEIERAIREMEEEEARREAKEREYAAKKKIADEEAKKQAEANRLAAAAENDRKLREAEREMERIEEERERQRQENEAKAAAGKTKSVAELLAEKISDLKVSDKKDSTPSTPETVASKLNDLKISSGDRSASASSTEAASTKTGTEKQRTKPSALNLAPINTKAVEPPQPSAALQSLKTARFVKDINRLQYPQGIHSPNPALNAAVSKKGNFKYDTGFLLQFKDVFTEKPSMEFDQQLKTLMGDGDGPRSAARTPGGAGSGRQGSRSAAPSFPAMGSFGAPKTLPPGTTSEQRFAMSSGALPRPNIPPMAQFGRPGSFAGPSQMSRTPSSSNMGGMPNSPRQGSRSTRGGSKRDNYNAKSEAQAAKTMPLTAGQEVKPIQVSATGWRPTSIGNKMAQAPTVISTQAGLLDPGMVQRKVKAALNKMTPEKFDKISDQILTIALQSKDEEDGRTLRQVIQLTFEKATDESHWAPMYARFCKRMLEMMSPEIRDTTIKDKNGNVVSGGALFRKYLLNRCQEEFERGWTIDLPKPKEGETKEMVMMSDEYYQAAAAKRRGLGLVQFIGELYKLGMLTERIMHECVRKLVDYQGTPDEAEIESLCKLLKTIGYNLDNTDKGKPMMDAYFTRIKTMMELPDLPSRLKFMLLDIIDLRRANWVSSDFDKGPKTLEEVRQEAEAAAAQKAAEAARSSQRGPPGGRPQGGRGGDGRSFSNYHQNQPTPNQVGMDDLRRLKGSAGRTTSSGLTLGPTSMFASRSNSGRRMGPGGSLGRAGEDSQGSSRTGTPPTRDTTSHHSNAFHVLANMETENPTSPPSTAASPALSKAVPDTSGANGKKEE